ncbi:MAG TPA: sugar transferase [Methylomirabilota bacterium]|nr:sugar transferase [Methylomirabilota bacterium]
MAVAQHLLPEFYFGDGVFYALVVVLALIVGSRVYGGVRHLRGATERLLIVGTSPLARLVIEEIARRPNRYALVGVVEDGLDLDRLIAARRPSRIVVAFADRRGRLPLSRLVESRARGIRVEDVVETYESLTGKLALELMPPSRVIFSHEFATARVQPLFARVLSLVVAVVGLVLWAPLMALIALAIKLDSRGPVFFVQQRAGRYRVPFDLIKFRTMRPAAGRHSEWERDNSDRITRIGRVLRRFRLDELPQLINLLKGDMNLVGPRPHPMTNLELLVLTARNLSEISGDAIPYYSLRCAVRPGITGWAQVRYRYANSLEQEVEKIRYDFYYLKHLSVWLDIRILFETVRIVVSGHRIGEAEVKEPQETVEAHRESA